jgi:hypothetical protein
MILADTAPLQLVICCLELYSLIPDCVTQVIGLVFDIWAVIYYLQLVF